MSETVNGVEEDLMADYDKALASAAVEAKRLHAVRGDLLALVSSLYEAATEAGVFPDREDLLATIEPVCWWADAPTHDHLVVLRELLLAATSPTDGIESTVEAERVLARLFVELTDLNEEMLIGAIDALCGREHSPGEWFQLANWGWASSNPSGVIAARDRWVARADNHVAVWSDFVRSADELANNEDWCGEYERTMRAALAAARLSVWEGSDRRREYLVTETVTVSYTRSYFVMARDYYHARDLAEDSADYGDVDNPDLGWDAYKHDDVELSVEVAE